jgi:hypothetical protein
VNLESAKNDNGIKTFLCAHENFAAHSLQQRVLQILSKFLAGSIVFQEYQAGVFVQRTRPRPTDRLKIVPQLPPLQPLCEQKLYSVVNVPLGVLLKSVPQP